MAIYDYQIGATSAGTGSMVNVESLATAVQCVPPEGLAIEPFSVYRIAASGEEHGDGFPHTRWFFRTMKQAQLDAFLALIGSGNQSNSVFIRTRKDDRSYENYQAIMHRPKPHEDMTPGYSQNWRDVTFRFTMLETA